MGLKGQTLQKAHLEHQLIVPVKNWPPKWFWGGWGLVNAPWNPHFGGLEGVGVTWEGHFGICYWQWRYLTIDPSFDLFWPFDPFLGLHPPGAWCNFEVRGSKLGYLKWHPERTPNTKFDLFWPVTLEIIDVQSWLKHIYIYIYGSCYHCETRYILQAKRDSALWNSA